MKKIKFFNVKRKIAIFIAFLAVTMMSISATASPLSTYYEPPFPKN